MDVQEHKHKKEIVKASHVPHRTWIIVYGALAILLIFFYLLIRFRTIHIPATYNAQVKRLFVSFGLILFILIVINIAGYFILKRTRSKVIHYNLLKIMRLGGFVTVVFIIISFLNANWYTAAVSLGLISLLLGFALQTPISSLIGWFYIVIRLPYKVGDRIQVNNFTGDVLEIGYLDTTLWEFAGDYLTNDLPTGRLIRFPNSLVFQYQVYNYSWKKFPYIWNEIPFHVAYDADLAFVEKTVREVATKEMGPEMEERIKAYKELVKQTPVDELEIKEYPFVNMRINPNTWVEVLLIYLVEPKHSSSVRTNLVKKIIAALQKEPGKVKFPKGDAR